MARCLSHRAARTLPVQTRPAIWNGQLKSEAEGAEMPVGTEDYIKLLHQEGDFQSSGRFSLEAKKALQKMQEFRLKQPAEYILQLVSCAVMRGASRVQIEIHGRDVRVGFDGEPFTGSELEQIFDCARQQSQQPLTAAGAHLAIALQAMRTYNPDVLIVESRDSDCRNVLQLYEQEVWIETLTGPGARSEMVTYVGLEHSLNFWNMCFPSLVGMWRAERGLLNRLAYASPIPVYVNGVCLGIPSGLDSVLLKGPGKAPFWAEARRHGHVVKDLPFWGVAVRTNAHTGAELNLIQAGIMFPQKEPNLPNNWLIYLQDDLLRRDLSQSHLVHDDRRKNLVEQALKVLR